MEGLTTVFDVTQFGVVGDGETNNTVKIAEIVSKLEEKGGGVLYFPPGDYVTGTVELKSSMTLYLEGGATILGSDDPEDYPMITSETLPGYAREGHSGLIKALNADHITITGRGTIDGRGYYWWSNPKNEHRPRAIQPILCKNVRISGITVYNSAMWTVHPICCSNVTIDGITIQNPSDSPNTDGINPESCSNVHIANCHVDVGDDCVTLKSGTEDDLLQKQHPCENITICNCTMINGHGGVVIGSEMSGGVRNVTISNCVFNGTDRGVRIKTRRRRGGSVEDIRINNIVMNDVFAPLTINGYYKCGADPDDAELFDLSARPVESDTPVLKNIYISNITARNVTSSAGYIYGLPELPVQGLRVDNYVCEMRETAEKITEKPIMAYHVKPTQGEGFYCANMRDVNLSNIQIKTVNGPSIVLEQSEMVRLSGLSSDGEKVAVQIRESRDILINNSMISPEAEVFAQMDEASSKSASLTGIAVEEPRQRLMEVI